MAARIFYDTFCKFFKAEVIFIHFLCRLFANISVVPFFWDNAGNILLFGCVTLYKAIFIAVFGEPIPYFLICNSAVTACDIDAQTKLVFACAGHRHPFFRIGFRLFVAVAYFLIVFIFALKYVLLILCGAER